MKGPFTIIKNYGLPLETNSSNIEIPFSSCILVVNVTLTIMCMDMAVISAAIVWLYIGLHGQKI